MFTVILESDTRLRTAHTNDRQEPTRKLCLITFFTSKLTCGRSFHLSANKSFYISDIYRATVLIFYSLIVDTVHMIKINVKLLFMFLVGHFRLLVLHIL